MDLKNVDLCAFASKVLSLTFASMGKNIFNDIELMSAMSAYIWEVFCCIPWFICNPSIVLHWCLTDIVQQFQGFRHTQLAVDACEMGTQAFCEADVLAPRCGKLDAL